MKKYSNFVQINAHRESDSRYAPVIQNEFRVTPEYIKRLGLYGELDSHTGCVNCLEWSSDGSVLASGSDDVHVVIHDPFRKKQLVSIPTGHNGNIFTVKFLPNTGNRTLVSGAADHTVRIHDVVSKDIIGVCTCHANRVKRCATDPLSPSLFWSAGEDGVIIQHDLRNPHTCSSDNEKDRNILVDLRKYIGAKAEAKCLTVNPVRTEHIAVGANDPFVRVFDRRMIKIFEGNSNPDSERDCGAVQYFVPGHLPSKILEYKKKYRSLAATYISYSPDGKELLVNLGGEQIYLFSVTDGLKPLSNFSIPDSCKAENHCGTKNGYKNGTTSPGHNLEECPIFHGMSPIKKPTEKVVLSSVVESLKKKANVAFEKKKYSNAIHLYNEAIQLCPDSSVLYGNRSAALFYRAWDGDIYAALRDCQIAIHLDPDNFKALLRLGRCLYELKRISEAALCLKYFKSQFPHHIKSDLCKSLDEDVSRAVAAEEKAAASKENAPSTSKDAPSTSSVQGSSRSTAPTPTAADFLRRLDDASAVRRVVFRADEDNDDGNEDEDSLLESDVQPMEDSNRAPSSDSNSSEPSASSRNQERSPRKPDFHEHESSLREQAVDFSERFCGHCNTTTDIKEASFFGGYIVAGSDDGSFYIWERKTTNIVKIVKGDESIVNCLQPHPSTCMLATSGIETVVRLWSPMPEEGYTNERVVEDVNDAAYANQRRMNSNPFEVILMNMGYRVSGAEDEASEDDAAGREINMPCNPT